MDVVNEESMSTRKLENGVDIHYRDEESGWTPLMHAASMGNFPKLRRQIERGAEINAEDNLGRTALMLTCMAGHEECARFLLRHRANIHAVNKKGQTVLLVALLGFHGDHIEKIIEILLHYGIALNIRDQEGLTALRIVKRRIALMRTWRQREAVAQLLEASGAIE